MCGDASTGIRCGAEVCEHCSNFFLKFSFLDIRECVVSGARSSSGAERCAVTPATRDKCVACRLQKCREVGMVLDAEEDKRSGRQFKSITSF